MKINRQPMLSGSVKFLLVSVFFLFTGLSVFAGGNGTLPGKSTVKVESQINEIKTGSELSFLHVQDQKGQLTVEVLSEKGEVVSKEIVDLEKGYHKVRLKIGEIGHGFFFVRVSDGDQVVIKKLVLS